MNWHDWWQPLFDPKHSEAWISGAAGIAGAILGVVVTTILTLWIARAEKRRERKERFRALAFTTYQRLTKIYSIARQIRDYMTEQAALAAQSPGPASLNFRGMNRLSGPTEFSMEELSAMAQYSDVKLINRVQALDWSFNSLLDDVDEYRRDRREAMARLQPIQMNGVVGELDFASVAFQAVRPALAALDDQIEQSYPLVQQLVVDAYEAVTLLIHAKQRPLGKKFAVRVLNPAGETVDLRAVDPTIKDRWNQLIKRFERKKLKADG